MKIKAPLIILLFLQLHLYGQQDLTLFQFSGIAQNNLVNPAIIPQDKIVVGLPVLSSINSTYNNRAFTVNDGLLTEDGTLVISPEQIVNSFDKNNFINVQAQDQWFLFGISIKKHYFQIGISEKASVNLTFPKKLFDFILEGNANFLGERVSLESLNFNASNYREISLGYATQLNEKWEVGAHLNLLFGLANISSQNSNVGIYTDPENYNITIDGIIELNTSGLNEIQGNTVDYLMQANNFGMALDLGAVFHPSEKWEVSASILDIGAISWKNDLKTFTNNGNSFTLSGLDIKDFISDNNLDQDSLLNEIGDSLSDVFSFEEIEKKYSTFLSPKFYAGTKFYINQKNRAYATVMLQFYEKSTRTGFSVGYEFDLNKNLGFTANYSIYSNSFSNLGLGLRLRGGPVQVYMMSDNLLAAFDLFSYKSIHFRFGVNLLFGERNGNKIVKNDLL